MVHQRRHHLLSAIVAYLGPVWDPAREGQRGTPVAVFDRRAAVVHEQGKECHGGVHVAVRTTVRLVSMSAILLLVLGCLGPSSSKGGETVSNRLLEKVSMIHIVNNKGAINEKLLPTNDRDRSKALRVMEAVAKAKWLEGSTLRKLPVGVPGGEPTITIQYHDGTTSTVRLGYRCSPPVTSNAKCQREKGVVIIDDLPARSEELERLLTGKE